MSSKPSKRRLALLSAAIVLLLALIAGTLAVCLAPGGDARTGEDGEEIDSRPGPWARQFTRLKVAGQFIWYDTLDALSRAFGGESESVACPTEQYEEPAPVDDSAVSELSPRSR